MHNLVKVSVLCFTTIQFLIISGQFSVKSNLTSGQEPGPDQVCTQSLFPPIWHTDYMQRSGFGCDMNYTEYAKAEPDYALTFCSNTTPWSEIPRQAIFLSIHCGSDFRNTDFAEDIERGVLGKFRKLITLKISICRLKNLTDETFKGLSMLSLIWITSNYIDTVSAGVFDSLTNMKWLQLDNNHFKHLNNYSAFEYCRNQKLEYIETRNNNISKIKFENTRNNTCTELRINSLVLEGNPIDMENRMFEYYHLNGVLNLQRCSISKLEPSFFYGLKDLQDIDLQGNFINELPFDVFHYMAGLNRIRLNDNNLSILNVDMFFAQTSLESLRLENNFISQINGSFSNIPYLTELNLANNSLTNITKYHFGNLVNLKTLNLSLNKIKYFEQDIFSGYLKLEVLDLSCNRLVTISVLHLHRLRYLSLHSNLLKHFDNEVVKDLGSIQVLQIQNNSLTGCGNFYLPKCDLDYFDASYNQYRSVNITCLNSSSRFTFNASHNAISSVNINLQGVTELRALVLDFSYNKLESFRGFSTLTKLQGLHLRHNNLKGVPCDFAISSDNVTIIDLGENRITNVCDQSLKSIRHLHKLYLDKNKLVRFNPVDVNVLHLSENPLKCSCANEALKNWLLSKPPPIKDNITCVTEMNSKKDILLGIPDNCDNGPLVRNIIIAVLSSVAFILGLSLVVFKFKYEIQVIAFYKWNIRFGTQCCKRTVSEQNNYAYDAFICFAEDDIQYVRNVLMPILESKYRLCIYHRDFPVGEDIAEAILNVIENSALTIVVLSRHFMQSRWGRYEFKQAHYNSMRHEHQKLLIIVIDTAVLESDLDLTLKSILFAKAYLKNEDVLFREKLLHVMPEKKGHINNVDDSAPLLGDDLHAI